MKACRLLATVIFLIFVCCIFTNPALGQNANSGELKGTVTDPSGAVVPEVAVSIKDVQTGVVTPTTTNPSGLYDVPFLAPGNYTITFTKQGFRPIVREGIVLHVETLEVSVALELGIAAQEIVVNAPAPLVETQTTEQHVDLGSQAIDAAPIVGTDWRGEMIQLIPGVNTGGGGGMTGPGQQSGVNGTQG